MRAIAKSHCLNSEMALSGKTVKEGDRKQTMSKRERERMKKAEADTDTGRETERQRVERIGVNLI